MGFYHRKADEGKGISLLIINLFSVIHFVKSKMRSVLPLLILSALPFLILCSQYVSLTGQMSGITKGNTNAPLEVQLIYDPACDNTANFDKMWKTVESEVLNDPALSQKVRFRYIPMPLPYHLTAHKLIQAIYYTKIQKGDEAALRDLRYFLEHIHEYSEAGTMDNTVDQIMAKIAKYLANEHGFSLSSVILELQHGSATERKVREWAKFNMGVLHVAGTPTSMINFVRVDGGIDKSKDQWILLLKKLTGVIKPRMLSLQIHQSTY